MCYVDLIGFVNFSNTDFYSLFFSVFSGNILCVRRIEAQDDRALKYFFFIFSIVLYNNCAQAKRQTYDGSLNTLFMSTNERKSKRFILFRSMTSICCCQGANTNLQFEVGWFESEEIQ